MDQVRATPVVSVVVPVYNAERYLAACLDSVLAQTYPHIEVIAVDDGSKDGSRDVLKRYGERVKVIEQTNAGASAARNRATALARGDLVAFIDADDLWDSTKLERMVRLLQAHPAAVGAYHDVRLIGAEGVEFQSSDAETKPWMSGDALPGLVIGRLFNVPSPSQAVVRRSRLVEVGGFPPGVRHAEDYALWLKLATVGPLLYLVDTLGSYRRHGDSVSVEDDAEFGRLDGRMQALLGIRPHIATRKDAQLARLYRDELLYTARTLGWFCRRRGDAAGAASAYALAAELAPRDMALRILAAGALVRRVFATKGKRTGGE